MRQGCISLGDIECSKCHRTIEHTERYLKIDEAKGDGTDAGQSVRYCIQCAIDKGYARYREESKGERTLTFFPGEYNPNV